MDDADPLEDATPTCEACLTRLEPVGLGERSWWRCPSCGLVRL